MLPVRTRQQQLVDSHCGLQWIRVLQNAIMAVKSNELRKNKTTRKRLIREESRTGAALTPCEGIFYVVRFPDGWKPVAMRFEGIEDCGHPDFWRSHVVPMLVRAWSPVLRTTMHALTSDLRLCEYGFPRGRVVKQDTRYVVMHGNDLERFMRVKRRSIEELFGIAKKAAWSEDDHEHCLRDDKNAIRSVLRISTDWKHVEISE